jgi:acetylornithine deacetylase/succinyl-diaminopimelate desuccinylase-like protein
MPTATTTKSVLDRAEKNFDEGVQRLCDLLRIDSISTDPAYRESCRKAGQWCVEHLRESGLTAELHDTGTTEKPGHPVVYAHHPGPEGYDGPHVLFYGHYDVQPPDPLDLWESPPFEPVIKEDGHKRIVARGAVDDKGQVMMFLEALRAWKEETGEIPVRVTVLLEGEEECASVNLEQYLKDHASALKDADICVVSDTGMWDRNTPAVTFSLRGLVYCEAILHGPNMDVHSGHWGGCIPNPLNELVKMFSGLFGPHGKCNLPGFYDEVRDVSPEQRTQWEELNYDEAGELATIGLTPDATMGEEGYTTLERQWARPTCDINGLYGGYQGAGAKTVIPSYAGAKISCRLVPDQDPEKIKAELEKWLRERTPAGCHLEFIDHGSGIPCLTPPDLPEMQQAREALQEATDVEPVLMGSGGSIPVVGAFRTVLGLETLLLGFGMSDDRVHSPNEKFEIECYRKGLRTHTILLGKFAGKA